MAINKITPRALDKATDHKLVPSTAFIDAVNVSLTEDESNEGDDGGDRGVIKNLKGNSSIRFYREDDIIANGDYKVIGTTVDRKLKLVYIYVYHEILAEQGVWVYDKDGVLSLPHKYRVYENSNLSQADIDLDPGAPDTLKCVAKGPFFKFKQHSVVQGSVVYGNGLNFPVEVEKALDGEPSLISVTTTERDIFEKSIHLFFTDNKNEPKKIDVTASMFARGTQENAFVSSNGGYFKLPQPGNELEEILFSYACRPTPLSRPTFDWVQDPDSEVSNFEKSEGFKFAYQIVFSDGSVSSISPKSQIAVTPSLLFQGKDLNPNHKENNVCRIFIKNEYINRDVDARPLHYIKQINVLAQEGDGPYKIIKEVDSGSFDDVIGSGPQTTISIDFKNDVLGIPVAQSQEDKYFDSVPQKAEAQAVVDNRLMFGNYVEGYATPEVEATFTLEFGDEFAGDFSERILVEPIISREYEDWSNIDDTGEVLQHMSGFRVFIEDDAFPKIVQGEVLNLNIRMYPRRNFHVYNASNSYHQTRKIGKNIDPSLDAEGVFNSVDPSEYVTVEQAGGDNLIYTSGSAGNFTEQIVAKGATDAYDRSFHAFKDNGGVAKLTWTTVDNFDWTGQMGQPQPMEVYVGTSAANPFIIPSLLLGFKLRFEALQDAEGNVARDAFYEILDEALNIGGGDNQSFNYDQSNIQNAYFKFLPEDSNVYDDVEWDVSSISHRSEFKEGDPETKLITMVTNQPGYPGGNGPIGMKCRGGIVAKKGKATFGVRKCALLAGNFSPAEQSKRRDYKIFVDSVPTEGLELWTFLRKWLPGSPWYALNPVEISTSNPNWGTNLEDFYLGSEFGQRSLPGVNYSQSDADIPAGFNVPVKNSGRYPRFANTDPSIPQSIQGNLLYKQYKDARDFNVPTGNIILQAVITEYNFIQAANPGGSPPNDFEFLYYPIGADGENKKIHLHTNTFIGYATVSDEIDGQYFICSGRPKEHMLNGTPLSDSRGKLWSLMDGGGGPGGVGPTSRLPANYFISSGTNATVTDVSEGRTVGLPYCRQIAGQPMRHPVTNATERASSAYGLSEFPTGKNAIWSNPDGDNATTASPVDDVTRLSDFIIPESFEGESIDYPAFFANPDTLAGESPFVGDGISISAGDVAGGGVSTGGPSFFGPWFTGKIHSNTGIHRTYLTESSQPDVSGDFGVFDFNFDFGTDIQDDFVEFETLAERDFYVIDPAYSYQFNSDYADDPTPGGSFAPGSGGAGQSQGFYRTSFGGRTVMPFIQGDATGVIGKDFSSGGIHSAPTKMTSRNKVFSTPFGAFSDPANVSNILYWHTATAAKMGMRFNVNSNSFPFTNTPTISVESNSAQLEEQNLYNRSFKSSSDHEFGVVFYDKLGRRSFVSKLGSVYVPGFSDEERGNAKGITSIEITLDGAPPMWAEKYQIVYGGNKSVTDFVQYSTNNAFIEPKTTFEDPFAVGATVLVDTGKIYMSLNMLQHSSLSHAKEFGARGEDGSLSIYKFSEGDKLRILSYGEGSDRVYPKDAVFDILEFEYIDPLVNVNQNPIWEPVFNGTQVDKPAQYFGEFVVLKDNEEVNGFNFASFVDNNPKWAQNVIFEIFSPKKTTGVSTQVYHEIGPVFPVIRDSNGVPSYSTNPVKLFEGDVFFRPHAVNLNKIVGGEFRDLLAADVDITDSANDLLSNFARAFLESTRPTDLFPSKMKKIGRPNVEFSDARTVRRESGIIYSDKSSPESGKLNYSSFNAAVFPYKDLEERFGNINFMDELGGNLFVIQQDRCTVVPVQATMLTNAVGQDQLIASNDILGKERVFSVTAGCDNNPESVVRVDTVYYFVHKSLGKIFRFIEGQGIEEISDANMGAYLRTKFKNAIDYSAAPNSNDVRIPGGFDPVKQEYLVTVLTPKAINTSSSDDNVLVYGCTDPEAVNYNPDATANNGTCFYPGDPQDGSADLRITSVTSPGQLSAYDGLSSVIHPAQLVPTVTQYGTAEVFTIRIENVGDAFGYIQSSFVTNYSNPGGPPILSWDIPTEAYTIPPGGTADITLIANPYVVPTGGYAEGANLAFFSNDGAEAFQAIAIGQVEDFVGEDPAPIPSEVEVKFYLGGRLIDQQFAAQDNGVWTVTVDQNNIIQAVNNSYATDSTDTPSGTRSLLEVELQFSPGLGIEISDQDKIQITGQIMNSLDGFEFTSL